MNVQQSTMPSKEPVTVVPDAAEPASPADTGAAREPTVGTVLKGKYRLESKIGEGGMGVVYKAADLEAVDATSFVAVKLLKAAFRTEASKAALFKEVEQTRKMQQENCIDVYGFEQDKNSAFMVMEFLNGRPLDKLIAEDYARGMPFKHAWPIIEGMGEALKYAHKRGIIHSDFKPSNVFVTPAGTKVIDFGVARAAGAPITGMTANYASCEMLEGLPSDDRDDVYAFGLVAYKLLCGKHPFLNDKGFETRATVARDENMTVAPIRGLTRRQQHALDGALRFDRSKRTKSIEQVLEELQREGPPVALWVTVGVLLAFLSALGSLTAYRWFGPQDSDSELLGRLVNSGASPLAGVDAQTVKQLLELGEDYLRDGRQPFDAGLLSENARPLSSALSVFQEVLKADSTNKRAANGILAIVKAEKAEAQRLFAAGQVKQAAQMTQIALKIWPDSKDLNTLDAKIRTQASFEPRAP